jgi:uncharacterized FlgJ-related protein
MIYKFNKETLEFTKINLFKIIFIGTFLLLLKTFSLVIIVKHLSKEIILQELTEYETVLLVKKQDEFSKDKLINLLKSYHLKFPHIALAQSIQETGRFSSRIFRESNNLFGMKQAKTRPTTALGTQYDHAYYQNWVKSVEDYILWVTAYTNKINKEEDFYNLLQQVYAGDPEYVNRLKQIIQKENLKELFKNI